MSAIVVLVSARAFAVIRQRVDVLRRNTVVKADKVTAPTG